MEIKTLIKALRCSALPKENGATCDGCPYRYLEKKGDFPAPADVTINGVEYYEECNFEKISLDSADELEKILNNDCYQTGYDHAIEDKKRDCAEVAENICDNFCKYRDTVNENGECLYMIENEGKCPLDKIV